MLTGHGDAAAAGAVTIDRLIRSRRRTVAIEIAEDGRLIVRAPHYAGLAYLERVVRDKALWIEAGQRAARRRVLETPRPRFAAGESFLYLGGRYPLSIVPDAAVPLVFSGVFSLAANHTHHPRQVFIGWYRRQAHAKLGERLGHFSRLSGLAFARYRVTDAERRWGSCCRGNLAFAWRLIMAPPDVIDYVVVHELAHTAEPNHSRRFWARVEAIFPDFRTSRQWLADYGHTLKI